jgi:hypothetical protein
VTPPYLKRVRASFRLFGLSKALPLVAGFAVVFLLFVSGQTVNLLGSALPPSISWRPDTLFQRTASDELIKCQAARFGVSQEIDRYELRRALDVWRRDIEDATRQNDAVTGWQERQGAAARRFSAAKFLLAWVLLSLVVGLVVPGRIRPKALLGWTAVFGVAAAYFLVAHLYAIEQSGYAIRNAAETQFLKQPACQSLHVPDSFDVALQNIREDARRQAWWNFRVGALADYSTWVYRNVLMGAP